MIASLLFIAFLGGIFILTWKLNHNTPKPKGFVDQTPPECTACTNSACQATQGIEKEEE